MLIRNTTSLSLLGRGIRKVIFICGEISDLVSDSDKHCTYLDDPDDMDLNKEFEERNEEEVEELKRESVIPTNHLFLFWLTHGGQVGNAVTLLSKNSSASSPTSRRRLMTGRLKNSVHFMQR